MQPNQATASRAEAEARTQWNEPTCMLFDDAGRLLARVNEPDNGGLSQPLDLGPTAQFEALITEHRRLFAEGTADDSMPTLVTATEQLLAEVYDTISFPLLHRLESFPRVALALEATPIRSLPIETAHRFGEPALFEVTQLYRTPPTGRLPAWRRPRRFQLNLQPAALGSVDVIALEQCLIHSVSAVTGRRRDEEQCEPLIHVAGHDPTIPEGMVEPDDLAHVVLSGCNSLPTTLPAGVASAVGSLWPVDENSNSSIMAAYHSRLAMGINPVESLRQAQMLHRQLPPVAWASYVHIGQPI